MTVLRSCCNLLASHSRWKSPPLPPSPVNHMQRCATRLQTIEASGKQKSLCHVWGESSFAAWCISMLMEVGNWKTSPKGKDIVRNNTQGSCACHNAFVLRGSKRAEKISPYQSANSDLNLWYKAAWINTFMLPNSDQTTRHYFSVF